jgi:hypothetical protein
MRKGEKMRDLLDRIRELRRIPSSEEVDQLLTEDMLSIPLLEALLKARKAEEKEILTGPLLEWMQENDQLSFETEDGHKVSIATYVSAKVEDADEAFKWLEERQYGDLIKDTLEFPKGEFTDELARALEEHGASYSKKSGIHPQSLKKIISDRLKAGEDLPSEDDGFVVNYYDEAKVK